MYSRYICLCIHWLVNFTKNRRVQISLIYYVRSIHVLFTFIMYGQQNTANSWYLTTRQENIFLLHYERSRDKACLSWADSLSGCRGIHSSDPTWLNKFRFLCREKTPPLCLAPSNIIIHLTITITINFYLFNCSQIIYYNIIEFTQLYNNSHFDPRPPVAIAYLQDKASTPTYSCTQSHTLPLLRPPYALPLLFSSGHLRPHVCLWPWVKRGREDPRGITQGGHLNRKWHMHSVSNWYYT